MSDVGHSSRSQHQGWLPPIQKPSLLGRVWQALTPEQRNYLTGYCWSFLFSTLMLVALAAITITAQQIEHGTFELAAVDSGVDDQSIDVSTEFEVEPLDATFHSEETLIAPAVTTVPQEISKPQFASLAAGGGIDGEAVGSGAGGLNGRELGLLSETDRKIAKAGGSLKGAVRVSLSFTGVDDLDLHVVYEVPHYQRKKNDKPPIVSYVESYHVYYGNKKTAHATLDVDANAQAIMPEPCENIVFTKKPPTAKYTVALDNFKQRDEPAATPYVLVIKYGSIVKVLEGNLFPTDRMRVVYEFEY